MLFVSRLFFKFILCEKHMYVKVSFITHLVIKNWVSKTLLESHFHDFWHHFVMNDLRHIVCIYSIKIHGKKCLQFAVYFFLQSCILLPIHLTMSCLCFLQTHQRSNWILGKASTETKSWKELTFTWTVLFDPTRRHTKYNGCKM